MSTKTLKLRKTQKFTFLKIQKTQNTGYIQNNGTGEPEINNSICWFTQSHSTECWLNVVTTIFKQYSTTIMLIWCFYNAFSEDINDDFCNMKIYIWKFQYPQTLQKNSSGCWRGRYPRNTDTWYTKLNNIVYVCGVCNVWIRIIGRQQCCILWI